LGNATPYDFIKEIQVKTGGYEAEFGQSTGGVVNVVTKSGSNKFRGSTFAYSQPDQLQGDFKQYQAANGTVNTQATTSSDVGARADSRDQGSPVLLRRNRSVLARHDVNAPPTFPLAAWATSIASADDLVLGEGHDAMTGGHRVDASFFGDPSHGDNGPQRPRPCWCPIRPSFSELDYGGHQQALRYSGILRNDWLVEGGFFRSLTPSAEKPSIDTWRVTIARSHRTSSPAVSAAMNRAIAAEPA
jgi:hypothetical protein